MANEPTREELIAQVKLLTDNQEALFQTITSLQKRAEDPFLAFRTPDPIRNLPIFSGNRKQTQAFIEDVDNTLELFADYVGTPTYSQIVRAIKNKIVDQAKEILIASGNPNNWEDIKDILINAYGDRRDLTSHIQSLFYVNQGHKTVTEYYNRVKSIETAIKTSASMMEDYRHSIKAINKLISLMTLTRFIDGLGEKLSMHVRSYRPETLESAYTITLQYANAAYRQKMDRTHYPPDNVKPKQPYQKPNSTQFNNNTPANNNYNKPHYSNHNQSGNFKFSSNKLPTDGDVSMRTARSKTQINTHEGERSENNIRYTDREELDTSPDINNDLLQSEDDQYFVGDELNFLQGSTQEKET